MDRTYFYEFNPFNEKNWTRIYGKSSYLFENSCLYGLNRLKVYSMEIAMVTNEIILSDEIADYPNHMLLSDFGGIFGFFVGITMLTFVSCLKKIYWYTIRVSQCSKKVCAFATSVLVKKFASPKITVAWIFRLQEPWHVLRKPSMTRSNLRVIEFLTVASHRISKMTCIFNWTIRAKMLIKNLKPDWMANQMSDILCSKIKFENFWNFY